jgi:peptidoglycan/xylan/chitin deacetylase (PgdA/CDA1 family)
MLSTTIQPPTQWLQGKPNNMTMVTSFQSGHGYTQQGTAGSTNLNDTSNFVLGTQAVSTVTNGAGGVNLVRNTAVGPYDLTSKQIGMWVEVDDTTHLTQLILTVFSGGGTTNFQSFKYYSGPANNTAQLQGGLWTFMTINVGDLQTSGGSFDKTNVTGFQLRAVDDNTGNTATIRYNGICLFDDPSSYFPSGVVSITFDDSFASQYTYGRAYMDKYGYPGVAYTICGNVNQAGWMTLTQLQRLRDQNGWEIAAHASTLANHNTRFTNLSAGDLELEFFNMQQWLVKNGFSGASHLALPGGQFNAAVLEKAKKYFSSVRTIDGTTHETLRPSSIMNIRAVSSISSFAGGVTAANVNSLIDTAAANKQWLVLVFHDIVTSVPTATTQCLHFSNPSSLNACWMAAIRSSDSLNVAPCHSVESLRPHSQSHYTSVVDEMPEPALTHRKPASPSHCLMKNARVVALAFDVRGSGGYLIFHETDDGSTQGP